LSFREKRIGVMMGGLSSEREISLKSGRAVFDALKSSGWNVSSLEVKQETEEEVCRLIKEGGVDLVFIAMHGGFGEDGRLQHILGKIRVPYTGPGETASRLAMDKVSSYKIFVKAGLHLPARRVFSRRARYFCGFHFLSYPVVVKPAAQGSSIGVSFVSRPEQLGSAVVEAFRYDDTILIEEFIKGPEITVSVLNGSALPIVAVIPKKKFFDFQAKYEKGMTEYIVPAPLDPEVARKAQWDAVVAYHALGCRHLARVDMIIRSDGTPVILEVNTIPGMTQTSLFPKAAAAAGVAFDQLCSRLVELAFYSEG
jgi:D-alanine-D-alanine ligase